MKFDEVLTEIGEFGRYQKIKYLLICCVGITAAFHALSSVFTIYTPRHRCSLSSTVFNGTDSWKSQSSEHARLIDLYVPKDSDGNYDSCSLKVYDEQNGKSSNNTASCQSWVYDDEQLVNSIITSWDLVCDKKLLATLSSSMFMFGNLVGSIVCGILSDLLGRRKTLLIGILGQLLSGIVMTFAPEFYTFTIFRFLIGIFNMQTFLTGFVLGMELIGPNYRIIAGIVIEIFWAIGFLILIGLGYAIKRWMYIQLVITLPVILFIAYYWLLPESARWLLTKGRIYEAEEILQNAARVNGKTLQHGVLSMLEGPKKAESPKALLRAPKLLIRTLIIFFNWFVISMTYYGLSLNSGNMPGSLYVNLTLSAVAELLGYLICFLCYITGRKIMHVVAMIVGGLGCICSIPILYIDNVTEDQRNTYFVALNFIGKLGVTIGFGVIYFWCAEIFPTVLRTSLMGGSSTFARIGSIFAPVIADIGKLVPAKYKLILPPIIFGILTISGGLLSIALPETTGHDLPDTIEEANIFPEKLEENTEQEKAEEKEQNL
ncbi:organic cation transporter protein-like [Watersipora subatra]|uniref:organic cation transporter protein-like n=1 Tax=Watersipora subatra TaxID=2589382 RepID=UPI00355B7A5C